MMKEKIDYYMSLPYKLEILSDEEGGFIARYPELPGCLTCSETMDDIVQLAEDAKRSWIEAALESDYEIKVPKATASYSGNFKIRMPKTMHKDLAERAEAEGVSMNQYCVYLLSQSLK